MLVVIRVSSALSCFVIIGIMDVSEQGEKDRTEDAILIGQYCKEIRIINRMVLRPPERKLPKGYKVQYRRPSRRTSYMLKGFELTVSEETSSSEDREQQKEVSLIPGVDPRCIPLTRFCTD